MSDAYSAETNAIASAEAFPSRSVVNRSPRALTSPAPWPEADRVRARVDVLVFSPEDVGGDEALLRRYAEMARMAVVTEDRLGCTVWQAGKREHFPAFEAAAVDPSLMRVVGPYMSMQVLPTALWAIEPRAREIFASGWRPPAHPGPTADELADLITAVV